MPIARLWDTATGKELRRFTAFSRLKDDFTCGAFSPDGKQVLTGGGDKTAHLWDAASGKELRELNGHTEGLSSVAFSPRWQKCAHGKQGPYRPAVACGVG